MLAVIGIGPGKNEYMTAEAKEAIEKSDLIVGYGKYIELVRPNFPQKNFFETGMMKERERCIYALEKAKTMNVALISSGDSCVYGMASLAIELAKDFPAVEIKIIAGVTAALSGGAILGSPLTADFAVISLSDHLMPKEKISRRLKASSLGDFCVVLYNPRSKLRPNALREACETLLEDRPKDTVCGYVRNIGRNDSEYKFCTLEELKDAELDMFCSAFIGNSTTVITEHGGRKYMVTPRGYEAREN